VGTSLPGQRSLHVQRKCDEFAGYQPNRNRKRVQHDGCEPNDERHGEPNLHVPEFTHGGYGSLEERISEWRTSRESGGEGEPAGNSSRAGSGKCRGCSDSASHCGTERASETVGASSGDISQQAGGYEDGSFGEGNTGRPYKSCSENGVSVDG
jgi:hypothetical protein